MSGGTTLGLYTSSILFSLVGPSVNVTEIFVDENGRNRCRETRRCTEPWCKRRASLAFRKFLGCSYIPMTRDRLTEPLHLVHSLLAFLGWHVATSCAVETFRERMAIRTCSHNASYRASQLPHLLITFR